MAAGPSRRLAIIGGGPRAVYALESLARRQRDGSLGVPQVIDVYEPGEQLGTGSAYAADQPDFIRLNLPSHVIDAGSVMPAGDSSDLYPPTGSLLRSPFATDLHSWLEAEFGQAGSAGAPIAGEELRRDFYPARSDAGRYLAALARRAIVALEPATVTHVRRRAIAVVPGAGGYLVTSSDGNAGDGAEPSEQAGGKHEPPDQSRRYDSVLLACGHAGTWPDLGGVGTEPDPIPVFPINELVATATSRHPERIVIRGMHLSGIDAVLALSQGLGGQFTREGDRHRYLPSSYAPQLVWTSRSGRLMPVKTETAVLQRYGAGEIAARFAHEILLTADLAGTLTRLANALLEQALSRWQAGSGSAQGTQREQGRAGRYGLEREEGAAPRDFATIWQQILTPCPDPFAELRASLARATGAGRPTRAWALGQAWRLAEPALIARQRRIVHNFPDRQGESNKVPGAENYPLGWPEFSRYAATLNALAFGPPVISAHKLLALHEAGILHIVPGLEANSNMFRNSDVLNHGTVFKTRTAFKTSTALSTGTEPSNGAEPSTGTTSEGVFTVTAISPPPGLPQGDPLWDRLASDGLISLGAGRGFRTGADATCIDTGGSRVEGLSAIGRMCEDEVLGLDTLVRTMHPEIERWADQLTSSPTDQLIGRRADE